MRRLLSSASRRRAIRNSVTLRSGIPRRRQVEVLGELLRDGAAAARELALLPVLLERLLQLVEVDALVREERGVLGDQHRALELRRDALVRHPPLHLHGLAAGGRGLARPQIHERRRLGIGLRERADVGQRQVDPREDGEPCRRRRRHRLERALHHPRYRPATTTLMRRPATGGCLRRDVVQHRQRPRLDQPAGPLRDRLPTCRPRAPWRRRGGSA